LSKSSIGEFKGEIILTLRIGLALLQLGCLLILFELRKHEWEDDGEQEGEVETLFLKIKI
jgi:hypothetical protein